MENKDIIVVGLQSWDIPIGSNCKDIALQFSRKNRVLYVNAPVSRITRIRNRTEPMTRKRIDVLKGRSEDLEQVHDNLWVLNPRTVMESINRIRINSVFDLGNYINNRRFAREILSAAARLGFSDYILFNDNDFYRGFHLKELLKPSLYVYYSRDNIVAMDYWSKQGKRIEPRIIAKADLVLTNSQYLERAAKRFNRATFNVGSGCDISLYDRTKITDIPDDIRSIPRPVVGYTGAILSLRLDPDLMLALARDNPSWNFVLVGPEDEDFQQSALHGLPNVHFLGNKKPAELPAYIHYFDVAINPQKVNDLTIGNYPRKIDEYLALGKPVVATWTETMTEFLPHVYLARNQGEFSGLIGRALKENTDARILEREAIARNHSWEANVEKMYGLMGTALKQQVRTD